MEAFSNYIKVSLIVTLLVGSPWVLYQLWRFVAPGLYSHERRFIYFLLPLSAVLTVTGVLFLYLFIMPLLLRFFIGFGSGIGAVAPHTAPVPAGINLSHITVLAADPARHVAGDEWINTTDMVLRCCIGEKSGKPAIVALQVFTSSGIIPQYRITEYVKLLLTLSLAFAGAFQAPVVVLLLGWAGVIDRKFLKKYRKHAVVVWCHRRCPAHPRRPRLDDPHAHPPYLLYEPGGLCCSWVLPASRIAGQRAASTEPGRAARRAKSLSVQGRKIGSLDQESHMSGAAAGAAAAAERRRREEEETMTGYSPADLADGWEFKILRSATGAFRNPDRFRQALEEESRAGWVLVEKFDNQRVRLSCPVSARAGDAGLGFDPYRTRFGMGDGALVALILGSVFGSLGLAGLTRLPCRAFLSVHAPSVMTGVIAKLRSLLAAPPPAAPTLQASDLDASMMRRALELAGQAAAMGEVPVGAIVYNTQTGQVLGEGFSATTGASPTKTPPPMPSTLPSSPPRARSKTGA